MDNHKEKLILNNLILQIHLDSLKINLEGIKQRLQPLQIFHQQQQDIEILQNNVSETNSLPDILDNCGLIKGFLENHCSLEQFDQISEQFNKPNLPERFEFAKRQAKEVHNQIQNLDQKLCDIKDTINKIKQRSDKTESWLNTILKTEIFSKVDDLLEDISKTKTDLANYSHDDDNYLITLWKRTKEIDGKSQIIFTEYVEFLSGLAMRGIGVDSEICNFADSLIAEIIKNPILQSSSGSVECYLTIPARFEAMESSPASLIRVGFPEWTIWTLPLVISEYGYVLVSKMPSLKKWTQTSKNRHLVVDAFATYTLGPAYACAVILLRLQPLHSTQKKRGMPSDLERYSVIITMLEKMNQHALAKDIEPYSEIINQLKSAWQESLREAHPSIPKLKEEDTAIIIKNVDKVWEVFKDSTFTLYSHDEWMQIRPNWQTKIIASDLHIQQSLRHILNGAWNERLRNHRETDQIAKNAINLWQELTPKPSTRGTKSSKTVLSPSSIKRQSNL